jgi:hypothetical protein
VATTRMKDSTAAGSLCRRRIESARRAPAFQDRSRRGAPSRGSWQETGLGRKQSLVQAVPDTGGP